jgi:hypothetical protein
MTAADNLGVVMFAQPADEIFDLVERLVDCSVRLQQLEQSQSIGDDLLERLAAFDARLTTLEKRQRRPPNFPITVISNETRKPEPTEVHPLVEQAWRRKIAEESERAVERRLKNNEISTLHGRVAGHEQTFDKMRAAFKQMSARIAAVETQLRVGGNGEANGGP